MKFLISTILIAALSFLSQQFLPWWSLVIIAFIIGWLMGLKGWASFLSGFLAIFLLWGIYAFVLNQGNEGILATRMANLLPLSGNPILLILVTAAIGGLVGGLGAATGSLGRQWASPTSSKKRKRRRG